MSTEIAVFKLSDMQVMADAIAQSGLFGMKSHQQALALMLVAQSENQHPATITQDYDIIQGKACRKTHSVMARFQQMGGKVEWHQLTESIADATFSHPQGGALRMTWTIEQAKKANLTGKDNWKNYPRAMLRARVIAEGVRAVYPAAIGGMLIAEEAQDMPRQEIEINPAKHDQPAQQENQNAIAEKPLYPQKNFETNLPKWTQLVQNGKTTEQIISTIQSKNTLTEEQIKAIRAIKPQAIEGEVMTEEEVAAIREREMYEGAEA